MSIATNLGFPRLGAQRELKRALESHWAGDIDAEELRGTATELRARHWRLQRDAGIAHVPSNDFSLYDHVLDTTAMLGAVPERYGWDGGTVDLPTYFAMARGSADAPAMELTKWFDTNYHYLVPELRRGMRFRLASEKPIEEFTEAKGLGIDTRPVLLGPVTYLLLGKAVEPGLDRLELLDDVVAVYEQILDRLAAAGADWVQIDEPCLATDLGDDARAALARAYGRLADAAPGLRLLLATYFAGLGDNLGAACGLPVEALHLDLVRGPSQLEPALDAVPDGMMLSLGVVDGRNVWRANLERALGVCEQAANAVGRDRILVAPSSSLLHVPIDLDLEPELGDVQRWLAFATQKLGEVATLANALAEGRDAVVDALARSTAAVRARATSELIHDPEVAERLNAVEEPMLRRSTPFAERRARQAKHLDLPLLPTTTIGSFPQTTEVRRARAEFRRGDRDPGEYDAFLRGEIERCIRVQEELGIDLLVHGEFERADMVEYFGEQLQGFAFTRNGWVQSYGSRGVKPPIIFGDVARPKPMTVDWMRYAQSLTDRPVKGMLTGPVTILQWSFVRDDQPRADTCRQIALALRDEVADLEAAGLRAIQIDEPALREGLPLHRSEHADYLRWATEAFRLASSGVADDTQIHTHMCYSEFGDFADAIVALDADVLSVEAARSRMDLLNGFSEAGYPNMIGPGVYDIHSPRVPGESEIVDLLRRALAVFDAEQLWVNPDCGLKTRRWEEVRPALAAMVAAARTVREELVSVRA